MCWETSLHASASDTPICSTSMGHAAGAAADRRARCGDATPNRVEPSGRAQILAQVGGRMKIQGFRGFNHLDVGPLSRVNVLVGANNAGKTAVLEAAELLTRGAEPTGLLEILRRREEYALEGTAPDRFPYDVRSLFLGRSPEIGTRGVAETAANSPSRARTTRRGPHRRGGARGGQGGGPGGGQGGARGPSA